MIDGLASLTAQLEPQLSRNDILQAHAQFESAQQAQTPGRLYRDLLPIVYKRLAEHWGLTATWGDCVAYGESVKYWPAFSDSADSLQYLKKHFKLVVLSNVDNLSFAASNEKLGVEFDAIYTAEDVGAYKPSDKNFDYMIRSLLSLNVEPGHILHTAESLFHDHVPAKRFGISRAWIYRRHDQPGYGATMNPGEIPAVDFQFNSMADLVRAHRGS